MTHALTRKEINMKNLMKVSLVAIVIAAVAGVIISVGKSADNNKTKLYVYNWSDYMSPEVVERFEKEND